MKKPVIVLSAANAAERELPALDQEADFLQELFLGIEGESGIQTIYYPRLSLEQITATIGRERWAIQIFHFAGHSDGQTLRLTDVELAFGNLGRILNDQLETRIVFLNGCGTSHLGQELLKAGVAAVIVTKAAVCDDKAHHFARHFYKALVSGKNLLQSFTDAQDLLLSQFGSEAANIRFQVFERHLSGKDIEVEDPNQWELIIHPQSNNILNYRLLDWARKRKRVLLLRKVLLFCGLLAIIGIGVAFWSATEVAQSLSVCSLSGQSPWGLESEWGKPNCLNLVVDNGDEVENYPLESWSFSFPITRWERWECPQIYITRDGVVCSNPDFTIDPSVSAVNPIVLEVYPIVGKMDFGGIDLSNSDSLLLEVKYESRDTGISFIDTLQLNPPNWHISTLLRYEFSEIEPPLLEVSILDEGWGMPPDFHCVYIPVKKNSGHSWDGLGFSCPVSKIHNPIIVQ